MIDYFDIAVEGYDFPAIGKPMTVKQPSGAKTKTFTEQMVSVGKGAPPFKIQIETRSNRLRFKGSPAHFMQCQNGMGSNDFRAVVNACVPLVFDVLELNVPPSIQAALISGEFGVHEVHVAEHYRMPLALIPALCDQIRRFAPQSLCATALQRGIGVRLWPDSRDRSVLIYDKHHYFLDGLIKHKRKLMGNMPIDISRYGVGWKFDQMMSEFLNQGIRIETRLKRCLNRKEHPLNVGKFWTPETARIIHRKTLEAVPLFDLPPAREQEQLLTATTNIDERRLIALWLTGRTMHEFFDSDATFFRWRVRILDAHKIDISVPPLPDVGVRWSDVIAEKSLIEVPEWAKTSGFISGDMATIDWAQPHQLQRAWLAPEAPFKQARMGASRRAR